MNNATPFKFYLQRIAVATDAIYLLMRQSANTLTRRAKDQQTVNNE